MTAANSVIPNGVKYISLRTFKKDGSPIDTPVWFAHLEDKLIVFTDGTSYKVKRLRRDSRIEVATCDMRGGDVGEWHKGKGRLVESPSDAPYIDRCYAALNRKYGLMMRMGTFFSMLAGRKGRRLILELALDAASP